MDFRRLLVYLNLITLTIFISLALYRINISVKTFVDQPLLPNIKSGQSQNQPAKNAPATAGIGMANPASKNCLEQGGSLIIEKQPDGGEYGVCIFEDNRQCEEWALFRGECPKGGVKITGYQTSAARYCAIRGGQYQAVQQGEEGRGNCFLKDGNVCPTDKYYSGKCP